MLSRTIGLVFVCLVLTAYSNHHSLGVVSKCARPGLVSITFDDGVSKNYGRLLEILDREDVKATFFVVGETVKSTRDFGTLQTVYDRGHIIANHSWTHPFLTRLSDDVLLLEVGQTENMISLVMGEHHKYIRPPFGENKVSLRNRLNSLGYTVVLWNVDARDWQLKVKKDSMWSSYVRVFKRADPNKDSFIVVLHDTRTDSIDLVSELIWLIRFKGFRVVPLEECLKVV